MENFRPIVVSMCSSTHQTLFSGIPLAYPTEYRAVVGSLQYLSLIKPDISFPVNKMSQYMHKPTDEQWNAVKRFYAILLAL